MNPSGIVPATFPACRAVPHPTAAPCTSALTHAYVSSTAHFSLLGNLIWVVRKESCV